MDLTKQSLTPHSTQPSLCQSYVRSVFFGVYSCYECTCSFCVEITGGHVRQTGQETFGSLPLHLQGMWSLENTHQQGKTRVWFSCPCWILSTASACCKSSSNISAITQQQEPVFFSPKLEMSHPAHDCDLCRRAHVTGFTDINGVLHGRFQKPQMSRLNWL